MNPAPVRRTALGGNVEVVIPAEQPTWGQGVRPVAIQLLDADGEVLASLVTYLTMVRRHRRAHAPVGGRRPRHRLAPAQQPDGSVVMSPATLDRIDERVTVLEQMPDVPWTVAPRPETVDRSPGRASAA